MIIEALLTSQVSIDSMRRTLRIAREDVPGHEAIYMAARVLSHLEAVDALDDVQTTEIRAASCDALAFDGRVLVVVVVFLADLGERYGYIRDPVWLQSAWCRSRLRSGQHPYALPPFGNSALQDLSHAVSQALGDLDFSRIWIDFWTLGSSFPSLVKQLQDSAAAHFVDVEGRPPH